MNRTSITSHRPSRQAGFTLIEMLVVITIIAILASLISVASVRFIGSAKAAATRTTLKKVDEIVRERLAGMDRVLKEKGVDGLPQNCPAVTSKKDLVRELFPMTQAELMKVSWVTLPLPPNLDTPGEVFYFALKNAPAYGADRTIVDSFSTSELRADADGNMELIDAWEQPLRFYRWPTQAVKNTLAVSVLMPNAPTGTGLTTDPDDPLEACPGLDVDKYHDTQTWHSPLIVSSGPDTTPGLQVPGDANPNRLGAVADSNALLDDLSNLAGRAGGL